MSVVVRADDVLVRFWRVHSRFSSNKRTSTITRSIQSAAEVAHRLSAPSVPFMPKWTDTVGRQLALDTPTWAAILQHLYASSPQAV